MKKQTNVRGRALSLFLVTALLIVAAAVMVPIVTSADPAEIDDFGYQTLSALNLPNDDDTDLRFVFTVGSLDYTEVGVIVSKTVAEPTYEADHCYTKKMTTVYGTIYEDGVPRSASAGRYYVAVKLTNIPHEYFDGALYVRAFVKDGEGVRYSNAASLSVCSAVGHTHEIDDTNGKMVGGTAAMNVVGTKIGHCDGCNLDNVTEYGSTTSLFYKKWTAGNSHGAYMEPRTLAEILAGGKHFYPDESNGGLGNDLYIEYSVLWNETLLNLSSTRNNGAFIDTRFTSASNGTSDTMNVCYWSLANDVSMSDCTFAGGFEYGGFETSEPGNPYPRMVPPTGSAYADFPNIGGTDKDHPEWGWHRIGIVYHEEVTNLEAVRNGDPAAYKLTSTVYLDGEVISVLSGSSLESGGSDYKLFTCESDGAGGVTYSDANLTGKHLSIFRVNDVDAPTQDAYFAAGDCFATCGRSFVYPVTKIANPAARTETIDGNDFNGAFYYTTVGAHDHVWGAEKVNDASKAADCGHAATKSIHCTVCGATKPDTTENLPIDQSLHAYGEWSRISEATLLASGIDRRVCANCSAVDESEVPYVHNVQKFTTKGGAYSVGGQTLGTVRENNGDKEFSTAGNDLLIEYSVLWNESCLNLTSAGYADVRLAESNGTTGTTNVIFWSLTNNCDISDCDYAGGFEWGGIDKSEPGNPYPKMTGNNGVGGVGSDYEDFPNVGGTDVDHPEWGWHRVQIRVHQEVTNESKVRNNGAAAQYKLTSTGYIDGNLAWVLSATDLQGNNGTDRKLFTATGGGGTITYTQNDETYLFPFYLNNKIAKSGKTVYFEIGDLFVTIGSDFVQEVRRVASPTPATLEVESGVYVPATMWYELDD